MAFFKSQSLCSSDRSVEVATSRPYAVPDRLKHDSAVTYRHATSILQSMNSIQKVSESLYANEVGGAVCKHLQDKASEAAV